MIEHKIKKVSDDLCSQCAQCYEGECRAFEMPHTDAERAHRQAGEALCQKRAVLTKMQELLK